MLEAGEVLPGPARPRRAHPHRLLPPRELRPRLRGRRPRRAGARPLAERPRRPHAARARRRALRRRAAAPGRHDAHPPRRPLRPRAHPRRGGGHALGRDRRLRRPRPLGPRGDARGRASGPSSRRRVTPRDPVARRSRARSALVPRRQLPDAPGHARGRAAGRRAGLARLRLGAQGRVEDGHELRLPRRLGGGRHARATRWACGWATPTARAGPASPATRRPRPILFALFEALPGGRLVRAARRGPRGRGRVRPQRDARRARTARRGAAELVPRAGLDSPPCSFCRLVHTDAAGEWQVHGDCEPVAAIRTVAVVRPAAGDGDPLPPAPRRLPPAAALPARLPRGARGRGQRRRSPSSTRARAPPSTSPSRWTARSAGSCSRRPTATPRRASSGTSTTSTSGRDARHPPDGARPPARAARPRPRGRAGRDGPTALHGRGPQRPRFCYASRRACSSAG